MRVYTRVTKPSSTPITLAEAKSQLREEDNDYNDEITAIIDRAVEYADGPYGILGRCIMTQTWSIRTCFVDRPGPHGFIRTNLGYLQSITSVQYYNAAGTLVTLDSDQYIVETGEHGGIYPAAGISWPSTFENRINPVIITAVVGYPSDDSVSPEDPTGNVPASLKHALLLHVSHMFEIRDTVVVGTISSKVPFAYDSLVAPYRLARFGDAGR